jgi:hypothetical protein
MNQQQKPGKLRIHDNASVIPTYANKFVGSAFDGGGVTLTFGNVRLIAERTDESVKPGQNPEVYITQRLTLSPAAAVELINGLNVILSALRQAQAQSPATPTTAH